MTMYKIDLNRNLVFKYSKKDYKYHLYSSYFQFKLKTKSVGYYPLESIGE